MNFNEYIDKKSLQNLLGVTAYFFNRNYARKLAAPTLLTKNKVGIYKLQDIDDMIDMMKHAAIFENKLEPDFTEFNRKRRHYDAGMKDYNFDFDKFTTVTEAVIFLPRSKQSLQQNWRFTTVTVWRIKFLYKAELVQWISDVEVLDGIKKCFENPDECGESQFYKHWGTYNKWVKALGEW